MKLAKFYAHVRWLIRLIRVKVGLTIIIVMLDVKSSFQPRQAQKKSPQINVTLIMQPELNMAIGQLGTISSTSIENRFAVGISITVYHTELKFMIA